MIDLKTVKEIKIAEGSVTKITDSSGVVLWQKETGSSVSLDVDLNNQWVESTKTLDGYKVYMSNSNHNVDNGYASMKFKFKGMPDFKLWINSYAESNYDYTIAWNLDRDYPTGIPSYADNGVKAHTRGKQYNPTNITAFTEVDYSNDGGEHFVVVTYRKDSSVNANDDRGYVAVKLTLISTTWVVSATEFVKKDNKYYQRLDEVGTYEGGVTALTGNYKGGNELPVTYKQGSADDYMVVGSGKYYKNYIYVTPKDQEINTGDYVQGDYIGEATPAMKVTYTNNTEKTFYGLTSIDQNTGLNKANAKEVIIYDSVTSIGDDAFMNCSNLTGVTIGNSVTSIGGYAFYGCEKLTSVTIPDSVKTIGEQAFHACSGLTGVTIGNSVTSIGNYAFYGCSNLTIVTIPDSVTSIGDASFNTCSGLTSVTIGNSVTRIGNYAFYGCSNLTSVTIQNSTYRISYSSNAFANISSTAKLYVPSNLLSQYQSDKNWSDAFAGGIYAIGTIPTPAIKVTYADNTEKTFYDLTSIESDTVSNKANVKDVEIYDSVTSIGSIAFQNCTSLTSITIPESVTNIGQYAFHNCSNLQSINIPTGITSIGYGAFFECSSLTDITIPSGVTSIGGSAFESCSKLESVTIQNSTSKISYGSYTFNDIPSNAKLFVPSNLLTQYQSDSNWKNAFKGGIYAIGT